MICDVATAGVVGYQLCRMPSAETVATSIRRAIEAVGLPEVFYCDHGKEFTANRIGAGPGRSRDPRWHGTDERSRRPATLSTEQLRDATWQALGVRIVTALPYSAWSKPIESLFGAMMRRWENLLPGWCGRDARSKPEVLQRHLRGGRLLGGQDLEAVFARQIAEWNTEHRCGERARTPAEAYAEHQPRRPDPRALAFLLQERAERKVTARGVKVDGRLFMSEYLALHVGSWVSVRWTPGEEWIFVYLRDGECLAVTETQSGGHGQWGEANRSAKKARQAQLEHLRALRVELAGACTPEELDPTGAYRLVLQREQERAAEAEEQGAATSRLLAMVEKQNKTRYETDSSATPDQDRLRERARRKRHQWERQDTLKE